MNALENKKLLWVDDDCNYLYSIMRDLKENKGMTVVSVETCCDAWKKLSTEHFDFMLLDLIMPENEWEKNNLKKWYNTKIGGWVNKGDGGFSTSTGDERYLGLDFLDYVREKNLSLPIGVLSIVSPENFKYQCMERNLNVSLWVSKIGLVPGDLSDRVENAWGNVDSPKIRPVTSVPILYTCNFCKTPQYILPVVNNPINCTSCNAPADIQ